MDRRLLTMFKHEQTEPSDTWTINHWMGNFPIVDVLVMNEGVLTKIIPNAITVTPNGGDPSKSNTCVISFSTPFSGTAIIV